MTNEWYQTGETKTLDETCITVDDVSAAMEVDDCIGFCAACGVEHFGVNPNARNYPCEECGKYQVYGADDLLSRLPS